MRSFYDEIVDILKRLNRFYEIIFINDGSSDASQIELEKLAAADDHVRILEFSRNFGKEAALTAGLNHCRGQVAVMIDADRQHPAEKIPEFVAKWEAGAEVVVGVRNGNGKASFVKRCGSFLFYKIMAGISEVSLVPNSTDFRLLDRQVIDEFNKFAERHRMTRALISWLGFKRDYVYFEARPRQNGRASYSFKKLVSLAFNSFISLSLIPLKWAGYLGLLIIFTVGPFGLYILLGKYIWTWDYAVSFSGPAQLALLITFLVGIVLCSLGLVALYIAHIHEEVLGRPLYVIRKRREDI